ncbi:N,N'-diacetylbacillosaminyl-diphospho-undecaprenol alpha-1,3-N-acetylgalactosaminyltransferase [Rosistilla carotiformis]|uniref:N, N'-diacetylbacillosaminyl-diphospho-undecaprenol alpha-1,3-N-acetylgalactosaminyltransferase n=1 Tax=Rosistilla carotiformis TaxID=2528017 RepID=A0A518JR02_9BACT|nr:glycosyltransferase [Rosistilla carotiformis]QDV67967.1 N,N'-diacetylbacillosaminyl-diphospho-undecaprenol alpha-1,3-N-acetylgalactosaminyltransferase [Rosistilla carotiformis]
MRIDLVITELFIGGAERQLTELAIGLAERGAQVRVISLDVLADSPPQDQLLRRLRAAQVEVRSLGCRSVWAFPQAILRLRRLFAEDRPDLVQTFLFHANVLGIWTAARAGIALRVGGVRVAQPNRARLWLERLATRRMQAIVCVSQAVEDFARQHLASPQTALLTIPNGVDGSRFSQAAPIDWGTLGIATEADVILYVGRLHPQKGTDWLMEAAPRLLSENPRAALVIVGSGPWQAMVESELAKLPAGRTALMPLQAEIAPLMVAAKVLVLPSRYEGMPNVVMESMAANLPVVASDAEGVRELLGEMIEPQIVSFGDTDALCRKLSALLAESELRSEVVGSNKVRADSLFSVSAMVDRYRELYESLAANP